MVSRLLRRKGAETSEGQLPAGTPAPLLSSAAVPGGRERSPYWACLARFDGESRRNVQGHLDRLARILLPAGAAPADCAGELVPWEALRHQDTALLQAVLMARFDAMAWSAATVNAHLSALRSVITEAWRLGYMDAAGRDQAAGIRNLSTERSPAGRGILDGEIAAMLHAGLDR